MKSLQKKSIRLFSIYESTPKSQIHSFEGFRSGLIYRFFKDDSFAMYMQKICH